jgi:TonB family protein
LQLRDTMLEHIGKFTVSERIGRGTYSHVYRALDPPGRPVAIKISTTRAEPDHLSEFQRDLVAAASVLHPNLVSVHDLAFEGEFPYVVMELAHGRDVGAMIKANAQVSLVQRVRAMRQVGEALKRAHERGVFHLDVRPSKIMLSDDGAVKLLDLGLGRLSYDAARVTEHGYLIGSPFYMSPERLTAVDRADAQCDIWSFGVTFHEWISGKHPFHDDEEERMIGNIMYQPPEALAQVPSSLNGVILRALEKDVRTRYPSFTELLADLKPIIGKLQSEESEATLTATLKQTGRAPGIEARRIAPGISERPREEPAPEQFFGSWEARLKQEPSTAASPADAGAGITVKTPAPVPPPVIPGQRPLGPQRAAPKSSAAPAPVPSAGALQTQAVMVRPAAEPPSANVRRSTVRLLEVAERSGVPRGKVAVFAIAAMLLVGLLFFLRGPYSRVAGKSEISAEAKAISRPGRVINPGPQGSEAAINSTGKTNGAVIAPPADESALSATPKVFDPKSLAAPVVFPKAPPRRRRLIRLKPPSLPVTGAASDLQDVSLLLEVPPPPQPPKPIPQTTEAVKAAALRVGGSFTQPVLIHSVPPVYPPTALQRRAQGTVHLQATIAKDGSVKNLQVLSGDPLLDRAAREAVLQWKYRPALLNGEAVEVTQTILVKFNLSP